LAAAALGVVAATALGALVRGEQRASRRQNALLGGQAEERVQRLLARRGSATRYPRGPIDIETPTLLVQVRACRATADGGFGRPRISAAERRDLVFTARRRGKRPVLAMVVGGETASFLDLDRGVWIDPRDLRRTSDRPVVRRLRQGRRRD
jgi:hypothetical protein